MNSYNGPLSKLIQTTSTKPFSKLPIYCLSHCLGLVDIESSDIMASLLRGKENAI